LRRQKPALGAKPTIPSGFVEALGRPDGDFFTASERVAREILWQAPDGTAKMHTYDESFGIR
jgi:hypothetical protein